MRELIMGVGSLLRTMHRFHGGIVVLLSVGLQLSIIHPDKACNDRLPPFGPRLLQAKAVFGDVARSCAKKILAYSKNIRSDMVRKLMALTCNHYNSCRHTALDGNVQPVLECFITGFDNKSSLFYKYVNVTDALRVTAEELVNCTWKTGFSSRTTTVQAMDDFFTVARQGILSYGWN
ncbi:uncharacterized protein LOC142564919 isoform X1 [Dermacentor variabilis]|uniref:uncharacterized protein LOC142564919 isoform X1 n=2 Tax=Dermacentor variabilis TaxID=34621 RepID=UPI003F5C653F